MPDASKPPRRPRYRGTHPRQFGEKYKELHPEQYPQDVAKVVASGKTPAGTHRPILVAEILSCLALQPGETACDATLGYGGHAKELLQAVQPGGRLLGIDVDPIELPKTEARLRVLGIPETALIVKRMNFAGLGKWLTTVAPEGVDGLLADLGVSSMQLDNPERGFSLKSDGPLDMRMNPQHGQPAAELLSKLSPAEFATLLRDYADEPQAVALAKGILTAHQQKPLTTTGELVAIVKSVASKMPRAFGSQLEDDVRRVFQTLRIAVNDELHTLDVFLQTLPHCLRPGGRVAILTFHSGEDRRVKQAFKAGLKAGLYSCVSEDVIRPSLAELGSNPRAAPAKLRFAVRANSSASDGLIPEIEH